MLCVSNYYNGFCPQICGKDNCSHVENGRNVSNISKARQLSTWIIRGTNTGFGIRDLLQKSTTKAKFRPLGLNRGLFWDHFWTFPGGMNYMHMHMIHCVSLNRAQQWLTATCLLFSAASESKIRNLGLGGKIRTFLGPFWRLFGTKSRIRDLIGPPE